jgi:hypothetical protein
MRLLETRQTTMRLGPLPVQQVTRRRLFTFARTLLLLPFTQLPLSAMLLNRLTLR